MSPETNAPQRIGRAQRTTKESDISVEWNLDGTGQTDISTGLPFFDHMLTALGSHGCFDLTVRATGDIDIDAHHTVEDTGTVGYAEEYAVTPTVSGKILSCAVEEGDTVTAGQALYTIDSGELEDQIDQARISLDSANTSLAQARAACDDLNVTSYVSGTVTAVGSTWSEPCRT